MDHIQGLGFFAPLFRPGFEVHIWGPGSATADLRTRLTRYISPPLFPVRLSELPCDLHLHDLNEGCVRSARLHCPYGVRVSSRARPSATASKATTGTWRTCLITNRSSPVDRFADSSEWCSGFELAAGVDVLIPRRAIHRRPNTKTRVGWGHSTLSHALAFARLANVKHLMPFHHDPAHDDDTLDRFFGTTTTGQPKPSRSSPPAKT